MRYYSKPFFLIIILVLSFFMLINPQETVTAAASGFKLWFSVIVPALLPFFIVAELLVRLGFLKILGVLLEPVMRPVFALPGCSSLVVAMGFTSGFPVGAVLTRKLYDEQMLSTEEAERLVSFTNNSSPLFIIGAIGVGMFGSSHLGYLLAASHYLSNLMVGLLWGLKAKPSPASKNSSPGVWVDIKQSLYSISENNTGIGKILGDAIKNSLNNILAIAGFIIIFSVFTRMFAIWGLADVLAAVLMKLFAVFNLSYNIAYGWVMGIFEITIGAKTIIASGEGDILHKLLAVSSILAFSGLSIIAQIMSILAGTPIRLSFYLISRFCQMIFSLLITSAGYFLLSGNGSIHSFALPYHKVLYSFDAWGFSMYCLIICFVLLAIMVVTSLIRHLCD